jgi:hypothetical protein
MTNHLIRRAALAFSCAMFFSASPVRADTTIVRQVRIESTGSMGMGDMVITSTARTTHDRAKIDFQLKPQSRIVRMLAGNSLQGAEIVRLDQGKAYQLEVARKEYRQRSLTDTRAPQTSAQPPAKLPSGEKEQSLTGLDEAQCVWSDPTVEVKKTGTRAAVAGYGAGQTLIKATQTCKIHNTGSVCTVALLADVWTAPAFTTDQQDEKIFQRAHAQKTGASPRDADQTDLSMFDGYAALSKRVGEKMEALGDEPVRTTFALGVGGPQCKGARASGLRPLKFPGSAPAGCIEGLVTAARVTSEIVSVDRGVLDASTFEIPAGFKKAAL